MAAAARLALRARPLSRPNPGVAAVLVRQGRVIGHGWTASGGRPHAEAQALDGLATSQVTESTMYVTLEPCAHRSARGPACSDLLADVKPKRVVIGQLDPDPRTAGSGVKRLKEAGITVDVLDDLASARSLAGYLTQHRLGRPYVTLKLAQSLDGCIALADGNSQWITGVSARAHCHAMRAQNDAILVGGGTWRADRPRLDVRLPGLENRSPARIVLTRGVQPDGAQVINTPLEVKTLEGVLSLYIEGGAATAASFLAEDLVDELHVYRAPIVIGDGVRSVGALGLEDLGAAHGRWEVKEHRLLGSDNFTAYLRTRQ